MIKCNESRIEITGELNDILNELRIVMTEIEKAMAKTLGWSEAESVMDAVIRTARSYSDFTN